MKSKYIFITFLFSLFIFCTGCSSVLQINQKMIIQGIGIDTDEYGYKVTIQSLDFSNQKNDEPGIKVSEIKGKTLVEALESVKMQSGLVPMYSQNLILVIGKDAAQMGVNNFLDFFIRHYETRPNVKICVANSNASDVLSMKKDDNNTIKSREISELIPDSFKSNIINFVGRLKDENSDAYCAYLEINEENSKKNLKISGLAIFNEDKMVSFLDQNEYTGALILLGIDKIGVYNVYLENIGKISLGINKVKSKIQVDTHEKKFNIEIDCGTNIFEISPRQTLKIGEEEQEQIRNELCRSLKSICETTINDTTNLESDIFRLRKIILNKNQKYFEENKNNLYDLIKSYKFEISVNSTLDVTGTEI